MVSPRARAFIEGTGRVSRCRTSTSRRSPAADARPAGEHRRQAGASGSDDGAGRNRRDSSAAALGQRHSGEPRDAPRGSTTSTSAAGLAVRRRLPCRHGAARQSRDRSRVTPFAWSQPRRATSPGAGAGAAPSCARELGRSAELHQIAHRPRRADLPAQPDGRAGRRPREPLARARPRRFDVVHGFEPGLPSLSYLALRDSAALTAATFFSPERLGYPPGRAQRERLLGARRRAPRHERGGRGRGGRSLPGPLRARAARDRPRAVRARPEEAARRDGVAPDRAAAPARARPRARGAARLGARAPADARTAPRGRPSRARLRGRMRVRTARTGAARAELLRGRVDLRPRRRRACRASSPRPRRQASRSPRRRDAPAARARRRRDGTADRGRGVPRPPRRGEPRGGAVPERRGARRPGRGGLRARSPRRRRSPPTRPPLEERDWIVADLHMHTSWSHDCSIEVDELLDHAEAQGLGAIAVTDHNVFGGALEAVERGARPAGSSSSRARR